MDVLDFVVDEPLEAGPRLGRDLTGWERVIFTIGEEEAPPAVE